MGGRGRTRGDVVKGRGRMHAALREGRRDRGRTHIGAIAHGEERQRLAAPRRLEERVEEVFLRTVREAGRNDVRAQALARALGDELLERDEVLVAAVRAPPLILGLRERQLGLVAVWRCACPCHHRGHAHQHLSRLNGFGGRRDKERLGRLAVAKAVEHDQLARAERGGQRRCCRLHHRGDCERLWVCGRLERAEHLEAVGRESLGQVAANVSGDRLDQDLALRHRLLDLLVRHVCSSSLCS